MKLDSVHLHPDAKATVTRVDAFAEAGRADQIVVLTELRRRAGDDVNDVQTSILVGAFGILSTLFLAPKAADAVQPIGSSPWFAGLAIALGW